MRVNARSLIIAVSLIFVGPLCLAKGDAKAGKAKAALCSACHGMTGTSTNPLYPNLAGQHEAYLIKQLNYFKNGKRATDPAMVNMAKLLKTPKDVADVSAYFASQKPKK